MYKTQFFKNIYKIKCKDDSSFFIMQRAGGNGRFVSDHWTKESIEEAARMAGKMGGNHSMIPSGEPGAFPDHLREFATQVYAKNGIDLPDPTPPTPEMIEASRKKYEQPKAQESEQQIKNNLSKLNDSVKDPSATSEEDKIKEKNIEKLVNLRKNIRSLKDEEEKEYKRLLNLYGPEILLNPKILNKTKKEKYSIDAAPKNDREKIIKDYKDKTGKDPVETDQGMALDFNSQEEAISFFKDQAVKQRAFDVYNPEKNHRMYSDGKGVFVQGTKNEVDAYLKNPKDFELDNNGKPTNNPEATNKISI